MNSIFQGSMGTIVPSQRLLDPPQSFLLMFASTCTYCPEIRNLIGGRGIRRLRDRPSHFWLELLSMRIITYYMIRFRYLGSSRRRICVVSYIARFAKMEHQTRLEGVKIRMFNEWHRSSASSPQIRGRFRARILALS